MNDSDLRRVGKAEKVLFDKICEKSVQSVPADVQPVVRAKWEVGGMFDDIGRCSNCHYMFPIDTAITEFHFCPNCGADMQNSLEKVDANSQNSIEKV